MKRGFKLVDESEMEYGQRIIIHGNSQLFYPEAKLPVRADKGSAGYDFFTPVDIVIEPRERKIVWTNVKAYMQEDEVLQLHIRSSIGIKSGLALSNGTGIIDASYGRNIGIPLVNTSGSGVKIPAGQRIAQGVFLKYLVADEDEVLHKERIGGMGSSGL